MSRKNRSPKKDTPSDNDSDTEEETPVPKWKKTKQLLEAMWSISKIWLAWITIHYISVRLYSEECSGRTAWKIAWSPIVSQSPPCRGLLWAINTSSEAIKHMWMIAGGWMVIKLNSIFKYKED
jgi:hypothetical protein